MSECKRILVVGDLMLDEYIVGKDYRMSDEAPVPVLKVDQFIPLLGGAANVANNIKNMGCDVLLCGAIGEPSNGLSAKRFIKLIGDNNIPDFLIVKGVTKTTTKSRVIINDQQVVRFDYEDRELPKEIHKAILEKINCLDYGKLDLIVVSDYNKGVINKEVMDKLKNSGVKIISDPKPDNIDLYRDTYCVTPNLLEFNQIIGKELHVNGVEAMELITDAAKQFIEDMNIEFIVITLGSWGSLCCSEDRSFLSPVEKVELSNHIGAGDTFISALCVSIAEGYDVFESIEDANKAASIVVSKEYTGVCTEEEMKLFKEVYIDGS